MFFSVRTEFFALSKLNKTSRLLNKSVSGEFKYLGCVSLFCNKRPEKATTCPAAFLIGNITLSLKRSLKFPSRNSTNKPDFRNF